MGNILTIVFLMVGILGTYFFTVAPFSGKKDFPKQTDNVIGSILFLSSLIYFSIAFLVPEYFVDDSENQPCGKKSVQAQCYSLEEATCRQAWNGFYKECEQAALPIREKRPAAILSPAIYKCQARKFDKMLSYNRKNEDDSECEAYFESLKE